MRRKFHIYLTSFILLGALGVAAWFVLGTNSWTSTSFAFARLYNGQATIEGSLQFDAVLDPPVSQVGDLVALQLTLQNQSDSALAPEMELFLPESLGVSVDRFPSGATYNFQTRTINWQPILNASGGLQQATIYFTVEEVNPEEPEQFIDVLLRQGDREMTTQVKLWTGVPPSAAFSVSPVRASVGQPIQLLAETEGSGPFSQIWVLGDGRLVPASNPVVVYPSVGTYEIELQVANPLSTHHSKNTVVIVPEPAAFFRLSDTSPAVNQEVAFTSQSGGLDPLEYLWDFGDGTFSTELNPTHRYPASGIYDVVLTVRNEYGQAQNYLQVNVGTPPIADAVIADISETGQALSGQAFTDESTQTVVWDMGDGQVYEGTEILHTYKNRGDYIVTVNAINPFGNTTVTKLIRVNGGDYYIYLPTILSQIGDAILDINPANEAELLAQTIELVENNSEIILEPNLAVDSLSPSEQLIWYINEARRQGGLQPVNLVSSLSTASKIHTDDMAANMFTSHTGSDGSAPYERLARVGYREGGYAGETTAWGFRYGREAVDFWLNSPPHRAILLNPLADQFGVAQTTNYNAPSVWYWTAEFASSYGSIASQMLEAGVRLTKPDMNVTYEYGQTALFGWSWPLPLEANQQFVIYLRKGNQEIELGRVRDSIDNSLWYEYGFPIGVVDMTDVTGEYGWYVRLETVNGDILTRSEVRPLMITGQYPASPTPAPVFVPTIDSVEPTFTPQPTATPTATSVPARATITPQATATTLSTESTGVTPTATAVPTETTVPTETPVPSPTPTATVTPAPVLPIEGS